MVDALTRFPNGGPFAELVPLFDEVPYSYARGRIALTMAATDPDFGRSKLARTSLWDSETVVRDCAVALRRRALGDEVA
jgi:hypothetical protein